MTTAPLVSLVDVTRVYQRGRVTALSDVALSIAPGELIAVTGPSGCGKSTLLHILCGIEEPTAGVVLFRGRPVRSRREWTRTRARQIGVVFQAFNLLPTLTALENVEVALFGVIGARRAREARARELIEQVGLAARSSHRPAEMSGGEQQRVAIARSLASHPSLILADEPTGNLDRRSAAEILDLLIASQQREHSSLVIATHDPAVRRRTDRVLTMLDGRIVSDDHGES